MEQVRSLLDGLSQDELKILNEEIQQKQNAKRGKIAEMSSEVVDSNPYSRLMALKRFVLHGCRIYLIFYVKIQAFKACLHLFHSSF